MSFSHLSNPERLAIANLLETPSDQEIENLRSKECNHELRELQGAMELIDFQGIVASRLEVLDKEFGPLSNRFDVSRIAYAPEGFSPTPLNAAYGYALSVTTHNNDHLHFLALGYSIQTPFTETTIPVHNLLLSPTHVPSGGQDIFGQLNPHAVQVLEAQQLLYPKFAKNAKKILNRTRIQEAYSGSHTTTQEIVDALTQSPEYTRQTFGLGTSTLGDRMQAEMALDTFLVDILSSGKIL